MCSDTTRLQLKNPLPIGEIIKTFGTIDARKEIPDADQLNPLEEVSHYFPDAPVRTMVHLVVRLPHTGEYRPYTLLCIARVAYRAFRHRSRNE